MLRTGANYAVGGSPNAAARLEPSLYSNAPPAGAGVEASGMQRSRSGRSSSGGSKPAGDDSNSLLYDVSVITAQAIVLVIILYGLFLYFGSTVLLTHNFQAEPGAAL